MAGAFRIAEGYVEVTADESGYDRAMQRLRQQKNKVGITLELDDSSALAKLRQFADQHARTVLKAVIDADLSESAVRRVTAQLDRLTADRVVNIRANVDTRVGAAEIRNLTQRRTVRIGIDVDTRVAADSLANLTRRRQMTIQANADVTAARARIDALTRDRHVNVRVDSGSLGAAGSGGGGLGGLISSLTSLTSLAIGALPTMASLAQSIASMAPAAAIAAPAVLSLGAAFAAIKIGTSGIGAAFKAAFAPATAGASAAVSSTKAVEAAQRSLAKAQQGVKDAEVAAAAARVQAARQIRDAQLNLKNTVSDVADSNRRAAESVANAEQNLAAAQRAARQAQLDLTQARKDAAMELEDLNNRLADAQLNQRQDVLNLQDAEKRLAADKAAGAAVSAEQLAKDQLAYDQAAQALSEQQTETKRLQDQTAAANKAGVEGSDKVTKAKQNIADANQTVKDKTQALKDAEIEAARAQVDGAQKIAKAQRDLADAQANAAKVAKDSARQIANAQQAAADAARSLAEAQQSAALKTGKVSQALSQLSPQARAFVDAVIAQKGAWTALKLDVQDRLFQGLGAAFTTMARASLPSLRAGLVGTAGVLNTMAKNAANAVTQLGKTGMLRRLFDGLNEGLKPLSRIPGQFITGLAQISIAASPAFKRLTTAVGGVADTISRKLGDAFKSGHLESAINTAVGVAKQFGKVFADAFAVLGNVFKAAAAGGGNALGTLGSVFAELRRITSMPEVQKALTSIFTAINAIAKLLAGTLGKALLPLIQGFGKIAPTITSVVNSFSNMGPVIGSILLRVNPLIGGLMLIAPILGKLAAPISGLIKSVAPLVQMIATFTNQIIVALAPVIGSILKVLSAAFTALSPVVKVVLNVVAMLVEQLAGALTPIIDALVPIVQQFGLFLGQLAPLFPVLFQAVMPLLPPLAQLTVALLDLAMQVIQPLLPLIVGLAQLLTGVLANAITTLVPGITMVIGWITTFTKVITDGVTWVVDQFKWMYDVLVGHSIIPDLVKSIITWFTSLWTKTKEIFTALKNGVVQIWKDLWGAVSSKWTSFWAGFRSAFTGAWTTFRNSVSGLRTSITGTWSSLWNGARDKVTSIFSTIRGKISDFSSAMRTAFSTLKNSLGTIWDGVKSKIASPVKFVVATVYNDGIRKMWNTIAGKISSKLTLPAISLGFSAGGIVPGGRSNQDSVPAMLAPGERVLSNAQVDRLGGHKAIDSALGDGPTTPRRQDARKPVPGFAGGGIIGTITGALGSAADWAKNLVVGGLKDAAAKAISAIIKPVISRIPGGGFGGLLKGLSNKALDGILGWLAGQDKKAAGGQINYQAGAGVAQWQPQILQALSTLGQSAGWLGTVERRMNQESGGNPNVVNKWDSNWTAGTPSVGLMQVIGPTFRAYAGQFGGTGPFSYGVSVNPLANTYAGLNYAMHRYGSLSALNRPGGYDEGGLLQPGATLAVNRTGRPERILSAGQTELFEQMVRQGGGTTVTVDMTLNTMTIPTPAERRRFATAMAKDIKEAIRRSDRTQAR